MQQFELDALSLEYKRDYGTATRNIDISDVMNNPVVESVTCIFGLNKCGITSVVSTK